MTNTDKLTLAVAHAKMLAESLRNSREVLDEYSEDYGMAKLAEQRNEADKALTAHAAFLREMGE